MTESTNDEKMKIESSGVKIKSIIQELSNANISVDLVTSSNKRIPCIIHQFDDSEHIQIKLKKKEQMELLNIDEEYSIGCGKDGTIFNFVSKCIEDGPYVVSLALPEEINIIENRAYKRFNTLTLDNPYIEVVIKGEENVFIMSDLSQGGLSFLMPKNMEGVVKNGEELLVYKIGKQEFDSPLRANVVHLSNLRSGMNSSIKIGLKFIDVPTFN